jgi:PA14 domain/Bacterial Ig domain
MKASTSSGKILGSAILSSISATLLLAVFGSTPAVADIVYVTAMSSNCVSTTTCGALANADKNALGNPVYLDEGGWGAYTSAKAGNSDKVTVPGARYHSNGFSNSTPDLGIMLSPGLGIPGGVYRVYHVFSSTAGNVSTNLILGVTNVEGCTLSWTITDKFQRQYGQPSPQSWQLLGFLTNNPGSAYPRIRLYFVDGVVNAGAQQRLLIEQFKFEYNQKCTDVLPVGVTGPLAANLATVAVTGVSATATNLTIYQDAGTGFTNIGSLAVSSPGATVAVPVSGKLIKGARVGATQTIGGQEGCTPPAAVQPVGGGANPRIRVAASIRQPKNVTGPIGVNGGGPVADIYWIHATGSAVAGGLVLQPSTNWQTAVFYPTDSKYLWNDNATGFTFPDPYQFGIFEGLAFGIDDLTDTGPMTIYIDNLRNGSTMIQDFENETNGTQVQFYQPSLSGSTSGNILTAPNVSAVSGNNAAFGTNSTQIAWQWNGLIPANWLRINSGSAGGAVSTPNPDVDLTQPILVDILVLPPSQTAGHTLGLVNYATPFTRTNCPGDTASFGVTVTPLAGTSPTYTYTWKKDGITIAGATSSSFVTNGISSASSGTYAVTVSDGAASVTLNSSLTVLPVATWDIEPTDTAVNVGDTAYFYASASPVAQCSGVAGVNYRWQFDGTNIADSAKYMGTTTTSLQVNNSLLANAGHYSLMASNAFGSVVSTSAWLHVIDTANQVISTGTGLLGLYYSNHLASAPFIGSASWTNAEYNINLDWGAGAPDVAYNPVSLVSTDLFTARWVGQIRSEWNQPYTFYVASDDGARLWVNDRLVVDSWVNQAATEHSGTIDITTNAQNIVLEYFENTGNAVVKLSWDSPSQVKDFVPSSQLFPAPNNPRTPVVVLNSPTNGAQYALPGTINLAATVTANFNGINKVQFYANGTNLVGETAGPPYNYSWTNASGGSFAISARALYDNSAEHADSGASAVTIVSPTPPSISGISFAGGSFAISGTGAAGKTFVLLSATNLAAPVFWAPVATNSSGAGSFSFSVSPSGVPAKFFRVQSQ